MRFRVGEEKEQEYYCFQLRAPALWIEISHVWTAAK